MGAQSLSGPSLSRAGKILHLVGCWLPAGKPYHDVPSIFQWHVLQLLKAQILRQYTLSQAKYIRCSIVSNLSAFVDSIDNILSFTRGAQ